MDNPSGGRDGRYASLGYSMGMIGSDAGTEIYGRPSTSQLAAAAAAAAAASQIGRGGATMMSAAGAATPGVGPPVQRGIKRSTSDVCYGDDVGGNPAARQQQQQQQQQQSLSQGMSAGGMPGDCVPDNLDESFTSLGQPKKSPPSNGKKTKGRVKIKMEYIDNKLRRYTTFSKRKTGIMKKVRIVPRTGFPALFLARRNSERAPREEERERERPRARSTPRKQYATCARFLARFLPDDGMLRDGSPRAPARSLAIYEKNGIVCRLALDTELILSRFGEEKLYSSEILSEKFHVTCPGSMLRAKVFAPVFKVRQLVYGSPHGGSLHAGYPGTGPGSGPAGGPTVAHPPPPPPPPPGSQHAPPSHAQHAHLIAHAHAAAAAAAAAASPSSHLVPCSSPGPMLAGGPYQQSCPSPLPPHHAAYHPHMSHSHPQR
ncbi:PREDICTED: uncharacterized protein LOC105567212 [Vollenhovia emeryi]|uniref:uncharacterized protein LOC105567212 n=1 Tax=Vollenhovia emeryi TaxID=411798 RepID=UPI0005F52CFB|nr:PREDICTED: uncharacterized protein LOC105567212 [Vollenhovia emeryi]